MIHQQRRVHSPWRRSHSLQQSPQLFPVSAVREREPRERRWTGTPGFRQAEPALSRYRSVSVTGQQVQEP